MNPFQFFQVEEVNTLVTEVANVSGKERALLEQCTDFISLLADMQVVSLIPSNISISLCCMRGYLRSNP